MNRYLVCRRYGAMVEVTLLAGRTVFGMYQHTNSRMRVPQRLALKLVANGDAVCAAIQRIGGSNDKR